jgi:hypothetical protein
MSNRTDRWPVEAAKHLIRIALVAAFVWGAAGTAAASGNIQSGHGQCSDDACVRRADAAGSVEANPPDDGAGADAAGGKATSILFGVKVGTTGGGDGSQ